MPTTAGAAPTTTGVIVTAPSRTMTKPSGSTRISPMPTTTGVSRSAKGQPDRAIADNDQAIRLDPNFAVAFYNRGIACYFQKDFDRAIADYDQAIQFKANNVHAYNNRGSAKRAKGDSAGSDADIAKAKRLKLESEELMLVPLQGPSRGWTKRA